MMTAATHALRLTDEDLAVLDRALRSHQDVLNIAGRFAPGGTARESDAIAHAWGKVLSHTRQKGCDCTDQPPAEAR